MFSKIGDFFRPSVQPKDPVPAEKTDTVHHGEREKKKRKDKEEHVTESDVAMFSLGAIRALVLTDPAFAADPQKRDAILQRIDQLTNAGVMEVAIKEGETIIGALDRAG